MKSFRRVAVLGAGTMGSRIAAHFANAGIPVLLLDIVIPGQPQRNAAALKGLDAAIRQKPGAFFTADAAGLITPGNFEDDLAGIRGCDWVIEAVAENLEIKRSLLSKVEAVRTPGTILSTNTSGIPLVRISEGFGDETLRHFLGTHFFNPPRYLRLVEVIPGPATEPEILESVTRFCDVHLGKGVVPCKDTPNFIANRIGSFFGGTVQKFTVDDDYTIEEVDALTGSLIGLPNSASYRLMDIVGLDIWAHVARNLHDSVPGDPWRERFFVPDFMQKMIERGWLGEKTGQGCYKRVGPAKEIHAIDWKTLDYHPAKKPRFPSAEMARNIEDLGLRLRTLIAAPDRAGSLLWKLFRDHVVYAAGMVPEISGRIVEIDRAMRWGYAHKLGPFELWDALDFPATAKRIVSDGLALPESVEKMLSSGAASFYRAADSEGCPKTEYFDLCASRFRLLEARPGVTALAELKRARGVVKKNAGASLVDLGGGVLCLEFHSKMNSIGEDTIAMIHAGIEETSRNYQAMIIANQGENFSAGANLMLVLLMAQEGEWDDLEMAVRRFQQANMAIRYSPRPVVAAPFGMTVGGGCEIAMHAARAQASAECYMGLVEAGVGLIPAGGGCKETLLRTGDLKRAFELIGFARVSSSAADARSLGLLREADDISMNAERLIDDAKSVALQLAPHYAPPAPRKDIPVAGEAGMALLKVGIYMARQGGYISEYDAVIGEKLAHVLSGGRLTGEQKVPEQYLLDLEREAFLSLCGQPKTQERMQHMLKTGKPLRN
ncbi:MAG TPA: 3-hydroxyacyl-CoA dehydrogenase/enoyl-CoA hydratase family protein [Bryobacteraceae bacterium]|nr:3-hydroxyacyl-CoA dehydrogenase/enoyl-CoA hydratase family protein [Bryobacteraceae bacterium]